MLATVVDHSPVSVATLLKLEAAVQKQSKQLRAAWGTPLLKFAKNAPFRVLVTTRSKFRPYSPTSYAWHGILVGGDCLNKNLTGPRCAVVFTDVREPWRVSFSHEVLEGIEDPKQNGYEICDPATYSPHSTTHPLYYWLNNEPVSDFVLPSYESGGPPPYDYMRKITKPAVS